MSALNRLIGAFRAPPDRDDDPHVEAQSALRPAKPCHNGFEEAFDDTVDEVMVRFAKALEHLAK